MMKFYICFLYRPKALINCHTEPICFAHFDFRICHCEKKEKQHGNLLSRQLCNKHLHSFHARPLMLPPAHSCPPGCPCICACICSCLCICLCICIFVWPLLLPPSHSRPPALQVGVPPSPANCPLSLPESQQESRSSQNPQVGTSTHLAWI